MAKYSSSINYKITTSLDASGITKLQAELNKLENEFNTLQKRGLMSDKAVNEALSDIKRIENALDKAFNPRLGMMNTKALMSELTAGGRSLNQIYGSLGTRGTAAMAQLHGQLGKIDTGMKSVSKTTDKVLNTLGNTVRWGLIASGFQYVLNGAHSAVQYMADLDKSLTNIRLVTDESKESMREFAQYANDAAKSLGNTTVAYTDAALIYAQQGYGLSDQKTLANYTLMTANATGQETAEVSEQMTALINGFQLSVEDVGSALDVMAKVANTSAADLEELATAASKVASTANTLGVTQEQLTAQIATIVSVTREAPENVGNALKTIYARFGDLSLGETLEDGTDLGKVSSTLQKIGVQVLDSSGAMRDMGLIMEDLMAVWDTLDTATKQGAAVTLAGKYQYNRLMALMENSDMYEGYYDDAINSAGTLEEMQAEYMESLAGKANALKASFEGLLTDLFNQDDFGVVIEGLTKIIDLFDSLVEAIGGGGAALTAFGAIGMNVFSNQIGRGISNIISNRERSEVAKSNVKASVDNATKQLSGAGVNVQNRTVQGFANDTAALNQYAGIMSDEQIQKSNALLEKRTQAILQLDAVEKKHEQTTQALTAAYHMLDVGEEAAQQGALGFLKTLEASGVGIEEAKQKATQYSSSLTNLQGDLVAVANALNAEKKDSTTYYDRLITAASRASKSLDKLKADLIGFGVSEEQVIKLTKVLQEVTDGESVSANKLGRILRENDLTMDSLRQSLILLGDSSKITAQDFEKLTAELYQARAAEQALAAEHKGLASQMQTQSIASSFAGMASGAMSLVFAMQSLKNLGSIWSNEDLEAGEKFEQLLLNGVMTAAMLSMAYVELSGATSAFIAKQGALTIAEALNAKVTQSLTQATAVKAVATGAATKANERMAISALVLSSSHNKVTMEIVEEIAAQTGLTVAQVKGLAVQNKLTVSTGLLGNSFKLLTVQIRRAAAALLSFVGKNPGVLAIAVALAAVGKAAQDVETAMSNYTEEIERHEAVLEKAESSNYENLYKIWSTTKESSEELKTAALELADSLGIVGAEALVEAGNFEALNDEIERGIGKTKELLESNRAGQNALISNANTTFDWRTDAFQQGFDDEFTRNLNFSSRDENVIAATGIQYDTFGTEVHGYSFAEQVGKIYQGIEDEQAKIDELTLQITAKKNAGEDTSELEKELEARRQTVQDLRAITTNENYGISDFTANTEGLAQSQIENADFSNLSYEEAMEKAKSLEGVVDYYAIYGEEAGDAFVQSVLGKLSYGTEVALDQWTANAKNNIPEGETGGEEKAAAIDNLSNTILNSSTYSEDDKVKIIGALDEEMTIEEINNTINAINEGKSVEEVALEAGGEEAKERAKAAYNLEGETKAQEFDIDVEEFKTYRDLLADTHPELKQNAKALNEVAVANKRLQKGVEDIADDWEDFNEIMTDSDSTIEDTSKVIAEMEEPIQNILNLSDEEFELLPTDFIQKNWGLIQDVMNGVEGSVDALRDKAGEEILMSIDGVVDPDGNIDAGLADLHNSIASFDAAEFTVGVAIDPASQEEFYANCQAIIDAAGMTKAQAEAYFGSMGYDVELEKVQDTSTATSSYQWFPLDEEATAKAGGVPQFKPAQTVTMTETKNTDALAIKTITPNGSYGGGIGVNTTPSKSSRGSSGGGGGGGSSYKPKTEKKSDEKADRYQNVNAHLDRLGGSLEKIADEQDRLAGKAMLDNMEQQIELIKQQTDWHQKKLEIQQQEAAELRKELSSEYGITFDGDGFMQNYEAMFNKFKDDYDALVDKYNAATTEEAQEKIKEEMDALKEKWDAFNESIERYDELMNNEIPESEKMLEELEDQIEDLRIAMFRARVEAADSIKEIKDAWADYMGFMSGLDPDSPFRSLIEDAELYESTLGRLADGTEDFEYLYSLLPQYQPGGTISEDNPYGENSEAFYEDLKKAYELYIELALEAEQLYYQQIDDIIAAYDDIVDRIDKRMESYARLTEQLDHYASMVEMVYGEEDYDKLLALKRANQDVLESSIKQSSASLEMLEQELAKMEAAGAPQEIIDDLKNKVVEAEQELEGLMEEAAQNISEILEMAVDKTVKEWKDSMLGGDADWMETQWELAKRNAEQYLDTVEETYEIEKLRSKYNSLANDTMDLNIRRRINDQMQRELAYLEEKDKLSEYDVNYANAKLEILQKQIALEEAQANKNQMKLRRDSQGNYSYVYAGDQDNIEQARSELLDAEFGAYEMSKENYIANYDNYIAAISQAAEQIKAINADVSLSEEEKAERTQVIYDNLSEYLKGVAEQVGVSEQGMIESVKYLAMDSGEIVGQSYAEIAKMMEDNWVEALGTIGVAVSKEFDSIIHNIDKFLADTEAKWGEFEDHTEEWARNIQDIADDGSAGFLDIDKVIIDINKDMKELNDETEEFFRLINDDLGTVEKATGKLLEYEEQIRSLKDTSSKLRKELEETRAALEAKDRELREAQGQGSGGGEDNTNPPGNDTPNPGNTTPGSGGGNGTVEVGDEVLYHTGDYRHDSSGSRPFGSSYRGQTVKVNYLNPGSSFPIHIHKGSTDLGWVKQNQISGFDTGGYTGVWGSSGKLAMLHQKELVLNASDTENILNAVSLMRDLVAAMKSDSVSNIFTSLGNKNNIATNTGNHIQQNIEIHADFPAAESAAEIKAALEGLAQQAVQYSFKER